jgi:hypothetical protein
VKQPDGLGDRLEEKALNAVISSPGRDRDKLREESLLI